MKPLILWLALCFAWTGVCCAQSPPSESSLREKLVKLRPETPVPELPPEPEKMEERPAYFEKTRPLWAAYWEKEHPRLLALAGVCAELLAAFPKTADEAELEHEMAQSYISVVSSAGPAGKQARERIDALLARPDLRAETAEQFYSYQINMIAILAGGENLDEIVPVTRKDSEIPDRIRQVVEKFAARYPASPALGRLSLSAAGYLEPKRSFARDSPPELREKWLRQAQQFGDAKTRQEVAKVRFREAAIGREAPPVVFTALDGQKVDLAKLKGKVVVLDFWATWCGPCVEEMPKVRALYELHHNHGLEVIGINLDSEREKLESFVRRQAIPWPQYFDGKGWENSIAEQFGVQSIPETWVIDAAGRVMAISPDDLAKAVEEQLAKMPSDDGR